MNKQTSKEDRAYREQQTADYQRANWTFHIKMTDRGGGTGRMVRRGN